MIASLLPNLLVLACLAGMAVYGWREGLFLATIAGLQVLASFLVALAYVPVLATFVLSWGVPSGYSQAMAFLLVFGLGILAVRLAVGAGVPRDAIPFAPLIDTVGGAVVGSVAGLVLGAGLLIGWSMADLPAGFRLETANLGLDTGSSLLSSFARCVLPAGKDRDILLEGESSTDAIDTERRCSEPFVDANQSGSFDAGERYLDLNRNGSFTRDMPFTDINGNGRRDFGLRECYQLAAWKDLAVLHVPRITSPAVIDVKRTDESDSVLYQATARDDEPGDMLAFALKPDAEDDAADLQIEAATGCVYFVDTPDSSVRKTYRFTVVVTDRHGLQTERAVRVSIAPARR
jgi:hypothetical protein